jgi:hypothetical protein
VVVVVVVVVGGGGVVVVVVVVVVGGVVVVVGRVVVERGGTRHARMADCTRSTYSWRFVRARRGSIALATRRFTRCAWLSRRAGRC